MRAGAHAQTLHERSFRNLVLPHLQLDELRTWLRSHTQVRLSLGRHRSAHEVHSGAASGSEDPPHCLPAYPSRARTVGRLSVCRSSPAMASMRTSTPSPLILGIGSRKLGARGNSGRWRQACSMARVMKHYQRRRVGASQTGGPAGIQPHLHRVLASFGLFWTSEHGLYRAGESDAASWCGSLGTTHLGHCVADSPFTSPSTVGYCPTRWWIIRTSLPIA